MNNYKLNLEFEVTRQRMSVTQGEAKVYCNGEFITNFADKIEMIEPGQKYFGEMIGGYASTTPDAKFIHATMFHKYDDIYHISDGVQRLIDAAIEQQEAAADRRKPAQPVKWQLRCMNAFVDGTIINDFDSDEEAARYAANYEATCIRIDPDGKRTVIYEPGADEE